MSFLGTLAKGVGGFLAGGPAGAIAATLPQMFSQGSPAPKAKVSLFPPGIQTFYPPVSPIGPGSQVFNPANYPTTAPGAGCPTGFRMNKSKYVTRGGGTSRWPASLQLHDKGTTCVRRRKLNPGNGKAATHAVRRLVAFYRLSNRVAKQLRRAAAGAKLGRGGRRGGSQRLLSRGGGAVTVVDTE